MPGLYLQGEHVLLETVSVQHLEERRILKRTVNDCSDFILSCTVLCCLEGVARAKTHDLLKTLDLYLKTKVSIPKIRMGQQQEIEILVNEEALLFAQYLRNEKQTWTPRIGSV